MIKANKMMKIFAFLIIFYLKSLIGLQYECVCPFYEILMLNFCYTFLIMKLFIGSYVQTMLCNAFEY